MGNKIKALVILSPAFAADEHDSALPSQELLVKHFNRSYPALKIIILTFHAPVRHDREYTWHNNRVITFNGNMKGKLHSLVLWTRVWQQLSRLRKDFELIGILSFFCSECAFIGHYFSRRHGLNHKIWVLGQDAGKDNHQVGRIKPRPEELVVISDFLQRTFEQNHHIRPAHIIPIGIDTTLFPADPGARDTDLLGAGSLIPLKQYDQFLSVTAAVAAAYPGLKAILLGNGPEEMPLKAKINELKLAQNIILPGKKTQATVLEHMQRSKVFLHTSAYEGLGVVCLEALYAGAQVISFCKPLNADIPHWHIVKDAAEMAAKALELLQDNQVDHAPVLPYQMEDTAARLMELFLYREH